MRFLLILLICSFASFAYGQFRLISKESKSMRIPMLGYNDNDGISVGILSFSEIGNTAIIVNPKIGLRSDNLGGEIFAIHNHQIKKGQTFSTQIMVRSYTLDKLDNFNKSRRGTSFNPLICYHLRDTINSSPTRSFKSTKSFYFQPSYVIDEVFRFNTSNPEAKNGAYRLFIPKIGLISAKTNDSLRINYEIGLEGSKYRVIPNETTLTGHYIKATASFRYETKYHKSKNGWLSFRVFGGGFLSNSARKSNSFQNIFARGSIALISQGFNDYTSQELFFSRQNQDRTYDNQISVNREGGFKTAIGSAYNLGMSNNYTFATNFRLGIPWKLKLPLFVYSDIGIYSVYAGNKFENRRMGNAGLGLNFGEVVQVFLPIVYSKDLGNIHKSQHPEWYQRISFAIEIQNFENAFARYHKRRMKKFDLI